MSFALGEGTGPTPAAEPAVAVPSPLVIVFGRLGRPRQGSRGVRGLVRRRYASSATPTPTSHSDQPT